MMLQKSKGEDAAGKIANICDHVCFEVGYSQLYVRTRIRHSYQLVHTCYTRTDITVVLFIGYCGSLLQIYL